MGQYYQFVNHTRKEVSQIARPFNFGMPYVKSLEQYEPKEIKAIFYFVIKHNAEWTEKDELIAEGDYGNIITFEPVKQSKNDYAWQTYIPKPVLPKPLGL